MTAEGTSGPRGRFRRWTTRLLATSGVLVLLAVGGLTWVYVSAGQSNTGELSFANPLRIPPLLEPTVDEHGRKHFQLTMQAGTSEFLLGVDTPT